MKYNFYKNVPRPEKLQKIHHAMLSDAIQELLEKSNLSEQSYFCEDNALFISIYFDDGNRIDIKKETPTLIYDKVTYYSSKKHNYEIRPFYMLTTINKEKIEWRWDQALLGYVPFVDNTAVELFLESKIKNGFGQNFLATTKSLYSKSGGGILRLEYYSFFKLESRQ